MADGPVRLEGLRDLQRALRSYEGGPRQRELRGIFNTAADRIVQQARRNASTPLQRKAAESVRARSQQRNIAVMIGGARHPVAMGAEFGADRDRQRTRSGPGGSRSYVGYRQFDAHTGSGPTAGRFFYPAIRSEREQVVDDALSLLDRFLADLEG